VNALLLCLSVLLVALCCAVLLGLRRLSRRIDARAASVDAATAGARGRDTAVPQQAIREAVRDALAEDRATELAEARAFWAEQEAREAQQLDDGLALEGAFEMELDPQFAETLRTALVEAERGDSDPMDPRRHPSHPDFVPTQAPSQDWTEMRLTELAELALPLAELRPGPLGTLDVYAFADDTTLCVVPGAPEAAARIKSTLEAGTPVWLLGQERFTGGHTLTFALGAEAETVFILADKIVASV
jgi:hypothetical protein